MVSSQIEERVRETALASLLGQHPEALFAALGPDGFRIPMPAAVGIEEHQCIPLPVDRASMVDLVVPTDGITVITTWERACGQGMSIGAVRTRTAPDSLKTLVFIDLTHQHGVMLGVLTDRENEHDQVANSLDAQLLVPLSPRTATITKAWNAIITGFDDRATRMLGWAPKEVVGVRSIEFIHREDHERALANWMEMLGQKTSRRLRVRHQCKDGSWLWVELENALHDAPQQKDITVTTQITDISDEMAAHVALAQRERLFRRLAESLPFGLFQIHANGDIVYANERLTAVLGTQPASRLDAQLSTVVEQDRLLLDIALAQTLEHSIDRELEVDIRQPATGELRRCAVTLIGLTDQEGPAGALACLTDITESARMREELRAKATFDQLTGCYNRASTTALLDQALPAGAAAAAAAATTTGVVFVDLEKFKLVNDQYGHAAGDELLTYVGQTLTGQLRDTDVVGRLGGDEFLIICPELNDPGQLMVVAERVVTALRRPVALSCGTLHVGASIGVAYSVGHTESDALIAQADAAMYESKRQGDGKPVLYQA